MEQKHSLKTLAPALDPASSWHSTPIIDSIKIIRIFMNDCHHTAFIEVYKHFNHLDPTVFVQCTFWSSCRKKNCATWTPLILGYKQLWLCKKKMNTLESFKRLPSMKIIELKLSIFSFFSSWEEKSNHSKQLTNEVAVL